MMITINEKPRSELLRGGEVRGTPQNQALEITTTTRTRCAAGMLTMTANAFMKETIIGEERIVNSQTGQALKISSTGSRQPGRAGSASATSPEPKTFTSVKEVYFETIF